MHHNYLACTWACKLQLLSPCATITEVYAPSTEVYDAFEKTLMLVNIEGRRRRGQQKMRRLDGITNSMDMTWIWVSSRRRWWTGKPVNKIIKKLNSEGNNHIYCCSVAKLCLTLHDSMVWACKSSLSLNMSWSLPKFMFIELVMLANHLILCFPLHLLPSIFPSIGVFSNESAVHIRWPKYWSFNFSISPFKEHSELISFRTDWLISLLSKGLSRVFSSSTFQRHQFFATLPSLFSSSHISTSLLERP